MCPQYITYWMIPGRLREERVLLASLILLLAITLLSPDLVPQYPSFVSWSTVFTLAALFIITTAIKESSYLDILAVRVVEKVKNERSLALILILLAFLLSMVITNDVALLVLVPFTLSLQKYIARDIRKMVIFEALAVNAGSALTPIGNPQNLYLWQIWGIGFYDFVLLLLPLVLLLLTLLLFLALIFFPAKSLERMEVEGESRGDMRILYLSLLLLVALIALMDLHLEMYLIPFVFLAYIPYGRRVYPKVDWLLLLTFILLFLDFNALGHLPAISSFLMNRQIEGAGAFTYGVLFSQFMSNVPAAVLLGNFTRDYRWLVWGVNLGGNGAIIASLANLIALRFVKDRRWMVEFHKYSLLYLLLSFLSVMLIWVIVV